MTIINGLAMYAMVVGAPRINQFNPDNPLWSIDVVVDKDTVKKLKAEGLGWKIKDAKEGYSSEYITFKKNSLRSDGTKNNPIEIVDAQGKPWDTRLIGNGSEVNIRYTTYEGFKKQTNPRINGIQVIRLVPFERAEPFPVYDGQDEPETEDDEIVH